MEEQTTLQNQAAAADEEESVKSKRCYTVGEFDGPLDLLWTLIRDNKINIYDIPIAQITEQFLEYLDYAASFELSDLSEFYSMAARLIYIKSRMMLPVEVKIDDDLDFDDPDYDKKENELIAPLTVKVIENLTEGMPTQEEAQQYIGKTGQELMDDGWTVRTKDHSLSAQWEKTILITETGTEVLSS